MTTPGGGFGDRCQFARGKGRDPPRIRDCDRPAARPLPPIHRMLATTEMDIVVALEVLAWATCAWR